MPLSSFSRRAQRPRPPPSVTDTILHHEHDLARHIHVCFYSVQLVHEIAKSFRSFNKYSQIAARALRQSLKETERVAAEKRGSTILRYQQWKDGQGGQQVRLYLHFVRLLSPCPSTPPPSVFAKHALYDTPRKHKTMSHTDTFFSEPEFVSGLVGVNSGDLSQPFTFTGSPVTRHVRCQVKHAY